MTRPTTHSARRIDSRCAALVLAIAAVALACSPDAGGNPMAPSLSATHNAAAPAKITADDGQPFEGTLEGASRPTYDPSTNSNIVRLVGTASAHPYGHFALEANFIVNLATELSLGQVTLTARNGDVITATFTGQSSPAAPGVISIVEQVTITGGTGRFAGASGSLVVERMLVRALGQTSGTFSGTLVREHHGN